MAAGDVARAVGEGESVVKEIQGGDGCGVSCTSLFFIFCVVLSWFMFIQLIHTLLGISTWDFVDVSLGIKDNFIVCLLSFTCSARYCCWALCGL